MVATARALQNERKCMNCRKVITEEPKDIYSRRFCSDKCKEEYLNPSPY